MKKIFICLFLIIAIPCFAKYSNYGDGFSPRYPLIRQLYDTWCLHAVVEMHPDARLSQCESADSYLHTYGFLSSDSDCCGEVINIRCKLDATVNIDHVVPFLRDHIGLSSIGGLYTVDGLFSIGQAHNYYEFPKVGIMLDWSCSHAILVSGMEISDDYGEVERCIWYNDPSDGSFRFTRRTSNILVTSRNGR